MSVHEYPYKAVEGSRLDGTMTLIGESGGLSSIYEVKPSSAMPGLLQAETEHGLLYLDPDCEYSVLDA